MRAAQSLQPDSLSPVGQQKKEIKMIPRNKGTLPDKSQDAAASQAIQKILNPDIEIKVPDRKMNCLCPITNLLMRDPVSTADGHTYEREAIEEWLVKHDTSPKTNDRLANKSLIPALSRKEIIDDLIEDHPEWKDSSDWYLPKKWIEELRTACQAGDEKAIQALAERDRRLLVHALNEETQERVIHFAAIGQPAALDAVIRILEKRQPGLALEALCQPDSADHLPLHRAILANRPVESLSKLCCWMGARLLTVAPLSAGERESKDSQGHTPLHRAILAGSLEMLQWLLTQQPDIKAVNNLGESALHLAARMNRTDMLTILLEKGVSLNATDKAGNTALHAAAQTGALEAGVILLKAGISPAIKNVAGQTPRQVAQAHLQGAAFLADYDKAVNQLAADEESMIRSQGILGIFLLKQQQIIQMQQECIESLQAEIKTLKALPSEIENLRRTEIKPLTDWRAALLLEERRKQEREKQGLELLPLQNELVTACERGDAKEVRALLDKGAKPNAANTVGKQPLGAAVWGMNSEVVNELLKQMGGISPMTWEECERHNLKEYKEVYMVTKFSPQTFREWSELLKKIAPFPFVRAYHLQKANDQWWHDSDQGNWENLCQYVQKECEQGIRARALTSDIAYRVVTRTEAGYVGFRTQIKQGVEAASRPKVEKTL